MRTYQKNKNDGNRRNLKSTNPEFNNCKHDFPHVKDLKLVEFFNLITRELIHIFSK